MCYLWVVLSLDVASADQQKAEGAQQDQDEDQNNEDVAMETEDQEEDLRAAEVQELKPEQLDSTKGSEKGVNKQDLFLLLICFKMFLYYTNTQVKEGISKCAQNS